METGCNVEGYSRYKWVDNGCGMESDCHKKVYRKE